MDISFKPEDEAFREEVRAFLDKVPPHLKGASRGELGKEGQLEWHKMLYEKGWVAPGWPVELGGTGWTITQKYIWQEESAKAEVPIVLPFGVTMVAPVIFTFGTDEQKKRFLPRILSGEDWWCQGYSEPGSGSDLASVRTKAELTEDGKHYIINGQKTWTTLAQYADWIFCLVRTDPNAPKRQQGISFILVDMKTPGIEVKPIITIGGHHEVNDVFFTDVKVPVENRIGEENQGWTYAKVLLGHERTGIAGVARSKKGIERLKEIMDQELMDGEPLSKDPEFQKKVAELEIDLTALEFTELRTLAAESAGHGPGPESSVLKIKGTEIQQRLTELTLEAVGHYGFPFIPDSDMDGWNQAPVGPEYAVGSAPTYYNMRKTSIYGGSNEIQRNIIAKMILGL